MGWHDLQIDNSLIETIVNLMEAGGSGMFMVHKTPLDKAKAMAQKVLGDKFDEIFPDFDSRYESLASSIKKYSKGIKRIDMPVINADQIAKFDDDLKKGRVDLFAPFAKGKYVTPDHLDDINAGEAWIELGLKDGNKNDDVVKGKLTKLQADKLKPIQTEIHFDKITETAKKFGKMTDGSPPTKLTIIVSADNYIIDGHHRWGLALMTNPTVKLQALVVPLKIDKLLELTRNYGDAIGNERNA